MSSRPESQWGRAVIERVEAEVGPVYGNATDSLARALLAILLDEVADLRERLARFEDDGR